MKYFVYISSICLVAQALPGLSNRGKTSKNARDSIYRNTDNVHEEALESPDQSQAQPSGSLQADLSKVSPASPIKKLLDSYIPV
ncbi:hypothetical protein DSO57_1002122 [Entomophthora muscae]|uniref:Uncharacterized protein n=1 Tax=Entomophthora muscae TaxID=34485 RepID=A0ACC2TWP8_9FUNG|nr:hypothetical protein DSO57_1002122 [Entomophthora muscae]